MKLSFKEWVAEEGIGSYVKGALGGLTNLATQAMGVPGLDELGANLHGMGSAASLAYHSSGLADKITPLTPQQIQFAKDSCYNDKSRSHCDFLCNKTGDKSACSMAGWTWTGKRWVKKPMA